MTRRDLLAGGTMLAGLAATAARAAPFPEAAYRRAIVIDGLSGLSDPYGKPDQSRLSDRAVAELRASGEAAMSVTVNDVGNDRTVWDGTVASIARIDQAIADNPAVLTKALAAADIRRAKADGRLALVYNVQDTSLVGAELDRLALLKGLGVRVVQLTYNNRNLSGDGCLEPGDAGISKLGRATIARIEAERMLLDLSHSGRRTATEALAAATRPPTISHTGCRALHDNPRNKTDAELRACAEKGGVVGIYWMPFLVPSSRPTAADLIRHMTHAVDVCGEDHVSIGTDGILYKTVIDEQARKQQREFHEMRTKAGIAAPGERPDVFNIVADYDSHLRFRMLADGLAAAGWKAARIEKILGVNLLRLYGEAWAPRV